MRLDDSAIADRAVAVRSGTVLAALGVFAFSFTFPATVWALKGFGPWTATGVRSLLAALVAAACLRAFRVPLPKREQWRGLAVVALGCVLAFPVLTTLALQTSSTAHSAVVIGLLPMATAVVSSRLTGHRPSRRFWLAAGVGASAVVVFTVAQSGGGLSTADLFLFAALVLCAFGYAEGGRLAREMAGWQVIGWALVLALPVTAAFAVFGFATEPLHITGEGIVGLAYVALISQFGGFFAWYKGMAEIGVARASQLQLAQPLLTLVWAVLLLGEHLPAAAPVTALIVLACIVVTQRSRS
ncbi:DMT family transporter [Amycolatopsis umgeniensis]|uniref:Drug/metabolite transporter (DMT)-like permease n=1 Tax=Amycolatopsis umgeniensis TaxID=336628 RepID=A0A841BEU9_9PSEU|nr:DMT family transporter [Amycolatopsis umgeniensis]MBB5857308.1 drug/metabolite transporter (DMT)-like permease [Amycolatopsis umgeniensis]